MKQLILVRHAKSSWAEPGMADIERPLNDRGRRDAPVMARRLLHRVPVVDLLISSTATRARQTAAFFATELQLTPKNCKENSLLYMADIPTFSKLVSQLPDEADTIALFSHNNGITAYVNTLTSVRVDNMPTCSIFAVRYPSAVCWADTADQDPEFLFFDYPKAHLH